MAAFEISPVKVFRDKWSHKCIIQTQAMNDSMRRRNATWKKTPYSYNFEEKGWEEISKHIPERSGPSGRFRYQNYLERRSSCLEKDKNLLAILYHK